MTDNDRHQYKLTPWDEYGDMSRVETKIVTQEMENDVKRLMKYDN